MTPRRPFDQSGYMTSIQKIPVGCTVVDIHVEDCGPSAGPERWAAEVLPACRTRILPGSSYRVAALAGTKQEAIDRVTLAIKHLMP